MDELFHECGIAAVCHLRSAEPSPFVPQNDPAQTSRLIPGMLLDMQNRGQLAAGFTTYNPDRLQLIDTHKDVGGVAEVLFISCMSLQRDCPYQENDENF